MSAEGNALVPVEEKTVVFYGDRLTAIVVEEEGQQRVYVPLRPICDYLSVA